MLDTNISHGKGRGSSEVGNSRYYATTYYHTKTLKCVDHYYSPTRWLPYYSKIEIIILIPSLQFNDNFVYQREITIHSNIVA